MSDDYRNNPPNYGNNPPNYGNNPPNYGNNPPNYGNTPPNHGGNPPNYGNTPPNYGNPPYGNYPPNYGNNPQNYRPPPAYGNDQFGYGGGPGTYGGSGGAPLTTTRKRSRRPLLIIPLVILLLLLIGGTAFAAFIPAFGMNADRSVGEMLPAGTAFYVTANLNPSGATKDNLNRIEQAYSSQPGWANIASLYNSQTENSQASTGACYRQMKGQISSVIADTGQDTTLAMTGTQGISVTSTNATTVQAAERALVVMAPLHKSETLLQALTGSSSFSLPQKVSSYKGTTIYKETFNQNLPSCGTATSGAAQSFYGALVNSWVVLGLVPEALHPVIDTTNGAPSLASTDAYKNLMSHLAAEHLGSYYLNGKALSAMGVFDAIKNNSTAAKVPASSYSVVANSTTAATLSVDAHGFNLTADSYNPTASTSSAQTAGGVSSLLPGDTLALLSIQGLKTSLSTGITQLQSSGLISADQIAKYEPILTDITADLSGETDLVMFKPTQPISGSDPSTIPLALMWQVNDDASASQHLDDAVKRLGDLAGTNFASQLQTATAADGTTYHALAGTYGYAVRKGWAIVALNVSKTLEALGSSPSQKLSDVDAYKRGMPGGFTPSSTWYVDAVNLRKQLESSLLPSQSASTQSSYNNQVKPFIAPIHAISGSVGASSDGKESISAFIVDIGSAGGS